MTTMLEDIGNFHRKFDLAYSGAPRALAPVVQTFRLKAMREELKEYADATEALADAVKHPNGSFDDEVAFNLEKALDALVDLTYFIVGTAYLHGFDFHEAWRRVHAANMAKVRVKNRAGSKRKSRHDVVKPPGWQPPRHRDLVIEHAHR